VFGATHLNNEPLMDWRYFLLATMAGVFYGWTFEKSKSLMSSALLHMAVDVIWSLGFHT
jgi:membrane protease YdiL (CAAX protease family)